MAPLLRGNDKGKRSFGSASRGLSPFQPWYLVQDRNGAVNVPDSFAPSTIFAILLKFITTGTAIGTLVLGVFFSSTPDFFFAYWTNLSLTVTALYQAFSFANTMRSKRVQQPKERVSGGIKLTWILFIIGVHGQVMASLLWWITIYPTLDTLRVASVFPHGVVATTSLIDGLFINRIPVRATHWWGWVLIPEIMYLAWTVIHFVLMIGNPNEMDNDPETNDDAIYSVLVWDEESYMMSAILSAVVVFVAGPLVYLVMWLISRYTRRTISSDSEEASSYYQKW